MKMIRGAGGGGKGGGGEARVPVEAPDNLRSRQYARVIDLVSEGEIVGLLDGLKSVYLDDTPIQNPDGSYNFTGVTLIERTGTQSQEYIPGFSSVEAETAVGAEVKYSAPVVRSISNANANAARMTISIPQLTEQNMTNGDLNGTSVAIAIDVQTDGGGFVAQPLSKTFNSNGFAISSTGATNTIASSSFQITVGWTGQKLRGSQTCTCELQYRPVGSPAWNVSQAYTFRTGTNLAAVLVGAGFAALSSNGSKTLSLTLPEGKYEFRVVKITGSIRTSEEAEPLVGIAYGGTVAITAATSYQPDFSDVISGKTTSRYQRSYRIALTGAGPWDIRVRRLTADSTSTALRNETYWDSYTEIIDAKLRYPNSALLALAVDAERFQSIPRRGYEMLGMKVRIPSNYDPTLRTYSGVWDGTFTVAWTNNPAWCFYDMVTSERYGLGAFIDQSQVDKWALYQIAQYCDELVDDGYGSIEPRFTCNLYLQTREEAYKVINSMASIFRGMAYWAGGSVTATQDAPSDPVALFTPANVIGGEFNYQGSSAKTRHTVALVSWNDPADRYKQKIEYVEDQEGIARYGVIQTEIVAIGCTSRGQAHRLGRWLLYTERMETETVTFRAGMDGLSVSPGEVIQTSDPVRAGVRMGGRILSATVSAVTLDAPVTIDDTKTYTLWAVLPDGTVESRPVTSGTGTTANLSVSPDFSATPQAMAMWVLAASDLVPETWRVISVAEVDNTQAEITALAYRADKYAAVEEGLVLEALPTSVLNTTPSTPTNLVISESLYLVTPVVIGTRLTVSWLGNAQHYELQYRRQGGNWQTLSALVSSVDIEPVEPGNYEFILTAINSIGRRSLPVSATKTVYGKTAVPQNVTGFQIAAIGGVAFITFNPAPDLDVCIGGHLRVRHTPETGSAEWSNAIDIGPQIPGTATNATLPLLAGTYLAKWVDSGGNESAAAVGIVTDAPNIIALNVLEQVNEHPAYAGLKTNIAKLGNFLTLDSAQTIDEQLDLIDSWPRLSTLGGISPSGEYLFAGEVDLGNVQTSRLTAVLVSHGVDALDLIDERPEIDTWPSLEGDLIADVGCSLYVRTTNDDPLGMPIWTDWTPLALCDYTARAFQFKADMWTDYVTHNILVSQLSVTVDMPDRIESGDDIVTGAGNYSVTFSRPFMKTPAIGISAQNMETGDYYEIINKTKHGFDITFRNAAGAAVSRTFDYIAKRY